MCCCYVRGKVPANRYLRGDREREATLFPSLSLRREKRPLARTHRGTLAVKPFKCGRVQVLLLLGSGGLFGTVFYEPPGPVYVQRATLFSLPLRDVSCVRRSSLPSTVYNRFPSLASAFPRKKCSGVVMSSRLIETGNGGPYACACDAIFHLRG